ncbi:(2,3-dihydroxybenzoyl)adenylate synthase [Bacillus massiliglaciei]|uniref:(2,3-dihydroxybenzoyl)adenylate synthase n=1 Tax=Bacillus massiliglaciei TaxID=1816693 RepID=UPI000A966783|nr:(2,3-dihydroxybenzoyl)adenylate synthase [Bacillus massiliglaciei]
MLTGCTPWPADLAGFYRDTGCWRGETFGGFLAERAKKLQDKIAVKDSVKTLTYKELNANADRLASGFRKLGIERNDRVVVQLPNITEFFEVCFALFRLGALPVFSLPLHRKSEITYFCEFTEAKAYIISDHYDAYDYRTLAREVMAAGTGLQHVIVAGESEEFISLAECYSNREPLPEISPGDLAFFQLSGGSTGLPKLIPRTHDEYIYSLRRSTEVCRLGEETVYLAALPVAHNFPMSSPGVFGVLYAGGEVILAQNGSPDETFPLIESKRVTITSLVPPLALIWLEAVKSRRHDFSSLQVLQVGGSKFSAEAARKVRPAFGCTLQQVFGMAEGLVNYTRLDDPEEVIIETQGRPMSPFDEVIIVDDEDLEVPVGTVGHLLTKGPYTIQGYYKAPEHNLKAFTKDGFYRTGDMVRLTEEGNLVVEGRDKDQINRGGEKIAAEEVENHLLACEAVHDAAVVAMPDAFLGERSCAYIIARTEEVSVSELKQFLRNRGIASFKIPDRIEFVQSFPYTALGKVSKKELRKMIAEKLNGSNKVSL